MIKRLGDHAAEKQPGNHDMVEKIGLLIIIAKLNAAIRPFYRVGAEVLAGR